MKMLLILIGATLLAACTTPPTPEQLAAYTATANAINNAALNDYKTIHAIRHSQ